LYTLYLFNKPKPYVKRVVYIYIYAGGLCWTGTYNYHKVTTYIVRQLLIE